MIERGRGARRKTGWRKAFRKMRTLEAVSGSPATLAAGHYIKGGISCSCHRCMAARDAKKLGRVRNHPKTMRARDARGVMAWKDALKELAADGTAA